MSPDDAEDVQGMALIPMTSRLNSEDMGEIVPISSPQEPLAQLKVAVGNLWRKVDEAKVAATQESQRTQEKLDTWLAINQSILESNQALIQAIVLNSQESRRFIDSSERGSQLLATLSSQLQQFEQAMTQLQATSMPQSTPSTPLEVPNLQALNQQLQEMQVSIKDLKPLLTSAATPPASVKKIQSSIADLDVRINNLNLSQWAVIAAFALLAPLILGAGYILLQVQSQIGDSTTGLNSAVSRLEQVRR
jgi:hypothetical protein